MNDICSYCGKQIIGIQYDMQCYVCMKWNPACVECVDDEKDTCLKCLRMD